MTLCCFLAAFKLCKECISASFAPLLEAVTSSRSMQKSLSLDQATNCYWWTTVGSQIQNWIILSSTWTSFFFFPSLNISNGNPSITFWWLFHHQKRTQTSALKGYKNLKFLISSWDQIIDYGCSQHFHSTHFILWATRKEFTDSGVWLTLWSLKVEPISPLVFLLTNYTPRSIVMLW